MTPVRTVERGYYSGSSRRAGQVRRVHVIRETPTRSLPPGSGTFCGQGTGRHRNSMPVVREVPHPLPEGLRWCPACLGHLAEQLGRLGEVARLLGAEASR